MEGFAEKGNIGFIENEISCFYLKYLSWIAIILHWLTFYMRKISSNPCFKSNCPDVLCENASLKTFTENVLRKTSVRELLLILVQAVKSLWCEFCNIQRVVNLQKQRRSTLFTSTLLWTTFGNVETMLSFKHRVSQRWATSKRCKYDHFQKNYKKYM